MNKKIITVISIALALVFVALLMILFSNIQSMGSDATSGLGNTSATLGRYELTRFDNKVISGKELKDAIENFRETSKGEKLGYYVWSYANNTNTYAQRYGYQTITVSATYTAVPLATCYYTTYNRYDDKGYTASSTYYIDDKAKFKCSIIMSNGVVYGIQAINTYTAS